MENRGGLGPALRAFLEIPPDERSISNSGAEFKYLPGLNRVVSEPTASADGSKRCLISSVISALGSYALTRLHAVESRRLRYGIKNLAKASVSLLKGVQADNCTMLDNLPFSTVLHEPFDSVSLGEGIAAARTATGRRIVIRGLNEIDHAEQLRWVTNNGFILIPYRRIFLVYDGNEALKKHRLARRELRLAQAHAKHIRCNEQLSDDELQTAIRMYQDLYLKKYSFENPDYSQSFIRGALRVGLLQSLTLRDDQNNLLGFLGFYENETQIAALMIGWTDRPDSGESAYRVLMMEIFRRAMEAGKTLNWSSGVAEFKMLRGGVPAIEHLCIRPESELERVVFSAYAAFYQRAFNSARAMQILNT